MLYCNSVSLNNADRNADAETVLMFRVRTETWMLLSSPSDLQIKIKTIFKKWKYLNMSRHIKLFLNIIVQACPILLAGHFIALNVPLKCALMVPIINPTATRPTETFLMVCSVSIQFIMHHCLLVALPSLDLSILPPHPLPRPNELLLKTCPVLKDSACFSGREYDLLTDSMGEWMLWDVKRSAINPKPNRMRYLVTWFWNCWLVS